MLRSISRRRVRALAAAASAATAVLASAATAGPAIADGGYTAGIPVCSAAGTLLSGVSQTIGSQIAPGLGGGQNAPDTISMTQSSYTASEGQGYLWIVLSRSSSAGIEQIRYGVKQVSASQALDFGAIPNTLATFLPGDTACQFPVTIDDSGMNGPPVTADAYIFGSSNATIVGAQNALITIDRDDPLAARDAANPLELTPAPTNGDPLTGAHFYVASADESAASAAADRISAAGVAADARAGGLSGNVAALDFIAQQPQGYRFWFWKTPADPAGVVSHYLQHAEATEPGTVVELSTYSLVHGACGSTANPAFTARYLNWVRGLAQGIGNYRVVLFLELDSIITSPCLSARQLHIRLAEQLKPAIQILEQDPHVVVYLDGGASDALPARMDAQRLREAGVQNAQGFFLNSTHFQWDTTEIAYGQKISRMLGGQVHFLVNSGVNGRGPLLNKHPMTQGVEQLCNPIGRGLGPISTQTGYTNVDGLLWFAPVGNSGGACRAGAPPTAEFWPAYAIELYQNRNFGITGPRYRLSRDGVFAPYDSAFSL